MDKWEYEVGEVLPLRREPENEVDDDAVAIMKDGEVVGHVPFNLTRPIITVSSKRCECRLCGSDR